MLMLVVFLLVFGILFMLFVSLGILCMFDFYICMYVVIKAGIVGLFLLFFVVVFCMFEIGVIL